MNSCATTTLPGTPAGGIALVGHHNVGKSALFQRLTGQYTPVSNYPGTTVEVARGMLPGPRGVAIIDTPGVAMLPARTEDEQVTARVLLYEPLQAVIQVGDAKNLRRTLLFTLQLAELGLPLALALNMSDEALARGVVVDAGALVEQLAIPVIPTVAITGHGIDKLAGAIQAARPAQPGLVSYPADIEAAVERLSELLRPAALSARALALFWLSGDAEVERWLGSRLEPAALDELARCRAELQQRSSEPLAAVIQAARMQRAEQLAAVALSDPGHARAGLPERLGQLSTQPIWGVLILLAILYAIYWFVGVFGAGVLVGLLEEDLFGNLINPWVSEQVTRLAPVPLLADALVGEYGLWSMGMTYALALILPIVVTFFLAFGVLEDSGYLARLAVLSNRLFRLIGLNGKAVLPMVLGLGCVTMATMSTRILESRRDRMLVILLLALAVPCSAQLGVVMGMLASISLGATLIWAAVMGCVLLAVGWLAARLIPGERAVLLIELPPLRWPQVGNVLAKTLARLEWYLKEVVPLFLLGTGVMFLLNTLGILPVLIRAGEPLVVGWLGLPAEASSAFLLGFLRRDFGATGLFALEARGMLVPRQVLVAMVTITLFIPCVASVLMIAKERGTRTALALVVLIFPLAFLVGGLLNQALLVLRWQL